MPQDLLKKFTALGDPTLLLLAALGLFFYLWSSDARRDLSRGWAVAFGLCVCLTIISKFIFYLFGWNEANTFRLLSPSGHVAIGTGFYGCCAMMLAIGRSQVASVLICVGTATLLGMLAASRIMLGLHTMPEIAVAFAIGVVSLVVFRFHLNNRRPIVLNAGQVICLLLLIDVAHYARVDGEALIAHLVQKTDYLRGQGTSGAAERPSSPAVKFVPQLYRLIDRQNSLLETTFGRNGDFVER